jgi:hypothetical protein
MKSEYLFIEELTNALKKINLQIETEILQSNQWDTGIVSDLVVKKGNKRVYVEYKNNGKNDVLGPGMTVPIRHLAEAIENQAYGSSLVMATSGCLDPLEKESINVAGNVDFIDNAEINEIVKTVESKLEH